MPRRSASLKRLLGQKVAPIGTVTVIGEDAGTGLPYRACSAGALVYSVPASTKRVHPDDSDRGHNYIARSRRYNSVHNNQNKTKSTIIIE